MNKKLMILTVASTALFVSGYLAHLNQVMAEDTSRPQSIVQRLVERFNLNQDEVDQVLADFRSERQAGQQSRVEDRLSQAVADGKITEEQKQLILQKQTEWCVDHKNWQNVSKEERGEQMKMHREEMHTWAEENGIDMKYLMGFEGRGGHRGMGMGGLGDMRGFGKSE